MTRQFMRSVCRALIGVVLFAQMAVSAYACPGLSAAGGMAMQMSSPASTDPQPTDTAMAATGQTAMNCEGMTGAMDSSFANLCAEHCHQGQQSDHTATVTLPATGLTALYLAPLTPEPLAAPRPAADATSALVAASPPYTILHCCFRI
jgi:hypothetical protein